MEYAIRVRTAAEWIASAKHCVAFTGAGISTESGLPDFRGPDGVWTRRDKGLPPPRSAAIIEPNAGHLALVEMHRRGALKFLISQNVDNLHLQSGIPSELLAELHGNGELMRCLACDRRMSLREAGWDRRVWGEGYRTQPVRPGQPKCGCGGRIISSVVNFGDPLPDRDWADAERHSRLADVFLVVGSSLVVTPAAYLPQYALDAGARLVLVNRGETPFDRKAHARFGESAGQVLTDIVQSIPR